MGGAIQQPSAPQANVNQFLSQQPIQPQTSYEQQIMQARQGGAPNLLQVLQQMFQGNK